MTADTLRDDLDHIHNLVVVSIKFHQADAIISLNSVHNAMFARTCMMSRAAYKGSRIEWYPDECAQELLKVHHTNRQPAAASPKKASSMTNRFQMLNMDGTEDGSDGHEDGETDTTPFPSPRASSTWTPSIMAI